MAAKVTIKDWSPGRVTAEIEKRAMDRLEKAAEMVASRARGYVPVDTGKLKNSIRVRRLSGDPKLNVRVYAGNRMKDGPFYAHMVEYGTRKMGKKPFLRPAFDSVKTTVKNTVENG